MKIEDFKKGYDEKIEGRNKLKSKVTSYHIKMTKSDNQSPPGGMVKSTLRTYYTVVSNPSGTKIEEVIGFSAKKNDNSTITGPPNKNTGTKIVNASETNTATTNIIQQDENEEEEEEEEVESIDEGSWKEKPETDGL